MTRIVTFAVCAVFAAVSFSQPASAEDECKDVLVNAVFNTLQVTKDSYYSMSLLSTLDEQSEKNQKKDASLGVVIEGIPISLSYSDALKAKSRVSKYYSLNTIAQEKSSYLLMSGQENIIAAWRDCMAKKSGLSVRFKPLDGRQGKQTLLYIEYYRHPDPTIKGIELELVSDVYLDSKDALVRAGADCLKSGKVYKPGDTCIVQLVTTSAWTTFPVVLLAKGRGADTATTVSYSAYLGPRAVIVGKTEPWPAKGPAVTPEVYAFDHGMFSPTQCFDTPDEESFFIEKSIKIVSRPRGGATAQTCTYREFALDQTGRRFCLQQVLGTPVKADHYCSLGITATQASVRWDPPPPKDTAGSENSLLPQPISTPAPAQTPPAEKK